MTTSWRERERCTYTTGQQAMTIAHCSCPLFRFGWPVLLVEIGLFPIQTDSKPSHPAKPKLNPTPKDLIPASPKLTSLLFSLHHDPTLSTASSFFFFFFLSFISYSIFICLRDSSLSLIFFYSQYILCHIGILGYAYLLLIWVGKSTVSY